MQDEMDAEERVLRRNGGAIRMLRGLIIFRYWLPSFRFLRPRDCRFSLQYLQYEIKPYLDALSLSEFLSASGVDTRAIIYRHTRSEAGHSLKPGKYKLKGTITASKLQCPR